MSASPNRLPLVMKTITAVTAVVTIMLAVLYQVYPQGWLLSTAISFGTTCYHFFMRLAVGAIVPLFTKNISYSHRWFQPRKWEPNFYRRLKVKYWKSALPTYDPGQFDLKKNTLEQVVRNTCSAEAVHEVIMVCSFVPLLFSIPFGAFPVFAVTSVIAALYDSIFVIAQRYNRPRLVRLLHKKETQGL